MTAGGHETVLHGHDAASGLQAIIAIHSTTLGPALGGTRFFPYEDERLALTDALRLSEGMTLKAAAAGLDLGGGKAVIIGDPATAGPELWAAYGRLVDQLGGSYITAEDVGTSVADMAQVRRHTRWVCGLPADEGGSGDPSPMTARGVRAAMTATAEHLWGTPDLAGRVIAIQGVGKVGAALARLLADDGAKLVVADARTTAAAAVATDTGAVVVAPDEILFTEADIVAPCALGAVFSEATIPHLRCQAIVGSANNQLAHETDAELLAADGVLYAPDFLVNAGGIINITTELDGAYDPVEATRRVDGIHDTMVAVFDRAVEHGVTPEAAAIALAHSRLDA